MPPRKKMPPRPGKKKPVFKSISTTKVTKPKKEESLGKKVGSRPRKEINKRRKMEKDLLADL